MTEQKLSDNEVTTFNAISDFIDQLNEQFGEKHKPLKLYHRLISQTTFSHKKAIRKHIEAFKKFSVANREAITQRNISLLKKKKGIIYSKRVYIDIVYIFKLAQGDTVKTIWKHLLYLSSRVDPAGKAREILTKNVKEGKTGSNEADFLSNIISKVENSVDTETKDPMSALSSIMSSGVFTDLIGGMQNGLQSGQLDLGKLMGAVQGMVSNMEGKVDSKQSADAMNMVKNMTNMMGGMGGGNMPSGGGGPDMSQMMSMMTTMMGSMGGMGGMSNVEQRPATIEEEVEEESEENRKLKAVQGKK